MKEKELRGFIQKLLREEGELEESDLIARDPDQWERMRNSFKNNVVTLIQHIEDDNYEDAKDIIGDTIAMLTFWRGKIKKGISQKPTGGEEYDMDRFQFNDDSPSVIDED